MPITEDDQDDNGMANRNADQEQNDEAGNLSAQEEIERIDRVKEETMARQAGGDTEMSDEEFEKEVEELSDCDLHPAHRHNITNARKVILDE